MKHISFHHILAATAIIATALGVGACAENDFDTSCTETRTIHFVGQAQPEQTRSSLTANSQGGLTFAWNVGDKVVLTHKATGYRVGTLTAKQISSDGLTATFEGDVEVPATAKGNQELTVAFLGNGATIPADNSNHTAAIDLSQQNGVANEMATHDVLFCSSLTVNVDQPIVNAAFSMNHLLAFEDYKFDLPKGVTLGDHKTLILDGRNVYNKCDLNLTTGELQNKELGEIDINCDATGFQLGQLNLAVIPAEDVLMSAHVTIGDEEYEYTPANPTTITAGYYYAPHQESDEAKHLTNEWTTVTSTYTLQQALDNNKGKITDLKIKIKAPTGVELPEKLEGYNSIVFKGVEVKGIPSKLMNNVITSDAIYPNVGTSFTLKNNGVAKNGMGKQIYETQGDFTYYEKNTTSGTDNYDKKTASYTKKYTTWKDNKPLYEDGNGGYTIDESLSGNPYKIITKINTNYQYSQGQMKETKSPEYSQAYINEFNELTTIATNTVVYLASAGNRNQIGTKVIGIATLEFRDLELELNSCAGDAEFIPFYIGGEWCTDMTSWYGHDVTDYDNNLTLKISNCDIHGAAVRFVHHNIEIENCEWDMEYAHTGGNQNHKWTDDIPYCTIAETVNMKVKNCNIKAENSHMFMLQHIGQHEQYGRTSMLVYNGDILFDNCKFTCTGTTNANNVIKIDATKFDANDKATIKFVGCTYNGVQGLYYWKNTTPSNKVTVTTN